MIPTLRRLAALAALASIGIAASAVSAAAQQPREAVVRANWELANKFGTQALQRINYSTALQARWIG